MARGVTKAYALMVGRSGLPDYDNPLVLDGTARTSSTRCAARCAARSPGPASAAAATSDTARMPVGNAPGASVRDHDGQA